MEQSNMKNVLEPELYFLLQKFLSASPLQETYKVLCKELEEKKILPARLDWEGNVHERSFADLERLYPHIGADHLLQICSRIGPILDKEIPPIVKGVTSLLGSGRQSLLRNEDNLMFRKTLHYYACRKHGMSICDPYLLKTTHNIVRILIGREMSGPVSRTIAFPPSRYAHLQLQRQTLGHLSAVYCLLFDHTGRYIITGADDLLVKLWSAYSGRLLSSFRGASSEITDIDINLENTLLAAGSIDRILRVWDLQTGAPIATLTAHTGMITSVHFCPSTRWDLRYLVTTSSDGSVAFWTYSLDTRDRAQFVSKPIMYQEKVRPGQSQMICATFSPGGTFLAAGSADHHVRVYLMRGDEGPVRILENEVHTDRVDSLVWAHRGLQFVSGSKDGTAYIWHFERQQWKGIKLCMTTKLPGAQNEELDDGKKLIVTMVAWDFSDDYIITAVSDHCLKVWRSATGQLERILTGHTDGIYVLESHPKDPYIVLSTGHDGQLFIWDVLRGQHVAQFTNSLDNGQGLGAVFDAKWSPDGSMFAASDSHGHIMIYGFGNGSQQLKLLPKELFFHTDYRPLVRDEHHVVLDEQTQVPPHLMPPPFLVDIDGNPYPPMLQRLVPGREHCTSEQLVPNIVIGTGGRQEVIQGLSEQDTPRSDIDRMIAALAQRQDRQEENEGGGASSSASPRSIRNTPRRTGDVEGVRQSTGDWQRDPNMTWSKHVLIQPRNRTDLREAKRLIESVSDLEIAEYQKENKKRPLMITTGNGVASSSTGVDKGRRRRRNGIYARPTRAHPVVQEPEVEREPEPDVDGEVEPEDSNNSSSNSDSTAKDLSLSDSSSDCDESSGYSDWVADQGVNLEPPKRSKRKSAHRKVIVDEDEEEEETPTTQNNTSTTSSKPKRVYPPKIKNGEIPEIYKALEWLSETVPRKAPYCPQMGDEVVYFVQGHRMYVDAVRMKKVYNVNNRDLPWTKHTLKDHEFVKIVGIKYEIRPPRLCCLKLALLDEEHKLTENVFTIKYHDMADVLDFFVLKQTYEIANSRIWSTGDNFRCMIDDGWWIGTIISKSALSEEYPESDFMCYEIQWDNGESERMSPWDLEPIREDRIPEMVGEAVPVLPDEIQAILYQPTIDEWPRGDRDGACRRIITGLDSVMGLAIAEPFLAPVDFNLYPSYAYIVEYPIDLSTIKARFENHFYRRITSAQFDVRYLATNAEKFNKPHSIIVKHARIITELCLRLIKSCTEELDVPVIYHQLMDTYETSGTEEDVEIDVVQPGPSNVSTSRTPMQTRNLRNNADWRVEAKKLLDSFWRSEDSVPFRVPVDRIKHPEYYQIIDTPIDLTTIKEDLFGGNYETPMEFGKDMRLIFQNSKNFNTNKRSKIYAMTVRLSATFEENFKKILYQWKRSKNKGCSLRKSSRRTKQPQHVDSDSDSEKENINMILNLRTRNHASRLTKKQNKPSTSQNVSNEDEDEEEEEEESSEAEEKPVKVDVNEEDDVDDDDDDDEDESEPESKSNNASLPLNHVNQSSSEQSDHIINNHQTKRTIRSDSSESDESDYEPLSKYKDNILRGSTNHKRKLRVTSSSSSESSSSSSSDSDSGIKKNLRPRNKIKKRKHYSDSDSDNLPLKRYERESNDDSETDSKVITVSSRGRVRKLTERARAFLRK